MTSWSHTTTVLCLLAALAVAVTRAPAQIEILDIPFATVSGRTLYVDVYLPEHEVSRAPTILWLHGGGWVVGDRKLAASDARALAMDGYAVVAADYRYSSEALWPAQIHDAKAAVRWIRAHADALGFDPWRIVAFGPSAGGQLAAVLAASGGSAELEGQVGQHLGQSSRVQGAIAFMAAHDILALDGYHEDPNSFESLLIGAPLGAVKQLLGHPSVAVYEWRARTASTVHWLDRSDPPMMFAHGVEDVIYPWTQSTDAHSTGSNIGINSDIVLDEFAGHYLPQRVWQLRLTWLREQLAAMAQAQTFGRGLAAVAGDEPSIGVRTAAGATVLTLDHAPPGAWAVAMIGPRPQPTVIPNGGSPHLELLLSPTAGQLTRVSAAGTAEVALAPPGGAQAVAQWAVVYAAPDGSIRTATSNALLLR